jgi:formylglycine-generating enzyme required for sulfatase activity
VGRCQVLLVVMGKNWVTPRLQNPNDFVRLEIESALGRNIPVVPVFLEGVTAPPSQDQLPESLHPLIRRNGTQVGHDPRFHADMGRLVKGLRDYFQQPSSQAQQPSPPATPPTTPIQTVQGGSASQVNTPESPPTQPQDTRQQEFIPPTPPQPTPKSEPTYPRFSFDVVTVNPQGQILDRQQSSAPYQAVDLGQGEGVTLDMVLIPGGSFMMGSLDSEAGRDSAEGPQHQVTLAGFWMGKYPVTQAQYQAIMGNNPAKFKGDNRPVEQVSWNDAIEFCDRLSKKLGQPYTLPSEAQWEYACRAGTTTPFHFGETITTDLANYDGNYTYGSGPKGTYRQKTTDVGSFSPNGFGLYDMHGNVSEWCLDYWHDSYGGWFRTAPADGSAWVTGGDSSHRVRRGGSWDFNPGDCRCAYRNHYFNPVSRFNYYGFRVVSVPPRALG